MLIPSNIPNSSRNTSQQPSSNPINTGNREPQTQPSDNNITQNGTDDQPANAENSTTNNDPVGEEHIQRNMLVSVSYVYSGDEARPAISENDNQGGQGADNRTGSVLLNVPNIPTNRTESQLNALIEFAASIALSALAANIRRHRGVKKEIFKNFPIKSKSDVDDTICPICFEEYIDEIDKTKEEAKGKKEDYDINDDIINAQGKRKRRASDEGSDNGSSTPRKIRRTESVSHPTNNNATGSASSSQESNQQDSALEEEFLHTPVVLPCNHVFGRNCLYEWLKSNSTCPLCRQRVSEEADPSNTAPERINIPNITSLLNPSSRDNPMVVVLDRATNTLTTRSNNDGNDINRNTPEANIASSLITALTEPLGIPISNPPPIRRDPFSASVLRSLDRTPSFPGLFPSGVSSRRTRTGVETVNLENSNTEDFDSSFYDESRRLLENRLRARNPENSENQQEPTNETGDGQSHQEQSGGNENQEDSNGLNETN